MQEKPKITKKETGGFSKLLKMLAISGALIFPTSAISKGHPPQTNNVYTHDKLFSKKILNNVPEINPNDEITPAIVLEMLFSPNSNQIEGKFEPGKILEGIKGKISGYENSKGWTKNEKIEVLTPSDGEGIMKVHGKEGKFIDYSKSFEIVGLKFKMRISFIEGKESYYVSLSESTKGKEVSLYVENEVIKNIIIKNGLQEIYNLENSDIKLFTDTLLDSTEKEKESLGNVYRVINKEKYKNFINVLRMILEELNSENK